MRNKLFIQNERVCIKPLRNRLEAIQRLQLPTTAKGCRSFAGMVNFLSMFCLELPKLLKPIYDLTRKGRPFIWGKVHQDSFEEIKHRLIEPPVLHMPNTTGMFHLYSDIVNLLQGVHFTKYKMANLSLLCMPVKDYQNPQKTIPVQNWNYVYWLSI